jgi:hypothetical protein
MCVSLIEFPLSKEDHAQKPGRHTDQTVDFTVMPRDAHLRQLRLKVILHLEYIIYGAFIYKIYLKRSTVKWLICDLHKYF